MKTIITLLFVIISIQSFAQHKGFYFNIGANSTFYKSTTSLGPSINLGYAFGNYKLSFLAHRTFNTQRVTNVCIDNHYDIKLSKNTYLVALAGLGINYLTRKEYINGNYAPSIPEKGLGVFAGFGFKQYISKKYAVNVNLRASRLKMIRMTTGGQENPFDRYSATPVTLTIGFGK